MSYPPLIPPTGRTNVTPQVNNHPSDHNAISAAFTDIVNKLGSDPALGRTSVMALLQEISPPGEIRMWPAAAAPTGWALCVGGTVPKATNPLLTGVLGTTYGAGDASNVALPDLRGRVPVGLGGAGYATALNSPAGNQNAVVVDHFHTASSANESPTHTHGWSGSLSLAMQGAGTHNHGIVGELWYESNTGGGYIDLSPGTARKTNFAGDGDHSHGMAGSTVSGTVTGGAHNHGITVNSTTGQPGTNANLQPYITVNFIIRLG